MSRQARSIRSRGAKSAVDPLAQAREKIAQKREHLLGQVQELDRILKRLDSVHSETKMPSKKSLEQLFRARDRSRPGSAEEAQAAESILEFVFPDTNAD